MKDDAENDSVVELLNRLRPAPPSPRLLQRLANACPPLAAGPRPEIVPLLPRFFAAAAVFVVCGAVAWIVFPHPPGKRDTTDATTPALQPAITAVRYLAPQETSRRLLGVRDLGISRDARSRPVRLMRTTWLDESIYSEAEGRPALREARLRDEIVPVVLTTY